MPIWDVESPDGVALQLELDHEPTEQELASVFADLRAPAAPAPEQFPGIRLSPYEQAEVAARQKVPSGMEPGTELTEAVARAGRIPEITEAVGKGIGGVGDLLQRSWEASQGMRDPLAGIETLTKPAVQAGARVLDTAGRQLRGLWEDIGAGPVYNPETGKYESAVVPYNWFLPDYETPAIWTGAPMPQEKDWEELARQYPGAMAVPKIAGGLIESAPRMGAHAALGPVVGPAVWGLTEEGFDPGTAATMYVLPWAHRYGGATAENIASKLGITDNLSQAAINKAAGAAVAAGILTGDQIAQLARMPEDQRSKMAPEIIGNSIAMFLMNIGGGRTQFEQQQARDYERALDRYLTQHAQDVATRAAYPAFAQERAPGMGEIPIPQLAPDISWRQARNLTQAQLAELRAQPKPPRPVIPGEGVPHPVLPPPVPEIPVPPKPVTRPGELATYEEMLPAIADLVRRSDARTVGEVQELLRDQFPGMNRETAREILRVARGEAPDIILPETPAGAEPVTETPTQKTAQALGITFRGTLKGPAKTIDQYVDKNGVTVSVPEGSPQSVVEQKLYDRRREFAQGVADEIGFELNPERQIGSMRLSGLSEKDIANLKAAGQVLSWEFTDRRPGSPTERVTFYVPEDASPDQIRAAYQKKLQEFGVTKPAPGGVPPVSEPPVPTAPGTIPPPGPTRPAAEPVGPALTFDQKRTQYVQMVTDRARAQYPNIPDAFWNGPWRIILDQQSRDFPERAIDLALTISAKTDKLGFRVDTPETNGIEDVAAIYNTLYEFMEGGPDNPRFEGDFESGEVSMDGQGETIRFYPTRRSLRDAEQVGEIQAGNSWHSDYGNVLELNVRDLADNRAVAAIFDYCRAVNEVAWNEDNPEAATKPAKTGPSTSIPAPAPTQSLPKAPSPLFEVPAEKLSLEARRQELMRKLAKIDEIPEWQQDENVESARNRLQNSLDEVERQLLSRAKAAAQAEAVTTPRPAGDLSGLSEGDIDSILDEASGKGAPPVETPPTEPESKPPVVPRRLTIRTQQGGIKTVIPYPDTTRIVGDKLFDVHSGKLIGFIIGEAPQEPAAQPPPPTKSASQIIADAAASGVKGIDETIKGLHQLFGGGAAMNLPAFDEGTYAKAKPHFQSAYRSFVDSGKSLKEFAKFIFDKFGEAVRPYLKQFLLEMQQEQGQKPLPPTYTTPADLEAGITAAAEPDPGTPGKPGGHEAARLSANAVVNHLATGKPLTKADVMGIMEGPFGGTMAQGKFSSKDMTDVIEMAVNMYLLREPSRWDPTKGDTAYAQSVVHRLKTLLERLPTQTTRTLETDKMQQFSTPPTHASVMAWVANLKPTDVVLEPSAGLGGVAVFAKIAGARVIGNELSPRRLAMLRQTGIVDYLKNYNAEHIDAHLVPEIMRAETPRPTVVEMNPPFSQSATADVKRTSVGAGHVEKALNLLPPGGRLVAIVGEGMGADKPAFRDWWSRISRKYNVRANIGINGEEYRKYGTTFDNQIIVIDKSGPTPEGGTVVGRVDKVEELIPLLESIRNDRPEPQSAPAQPSGPLPTPSGAGPRGPAIPPPPVPGPVGPPRPGGGAAGGGRPGPAPTGGLRPGPTPPTVSPPRPGGGARPAGGPQGPAPGPGAPHKPIFEGGDAGITVEIKVAADKELSEHGVFVEYRPAKVHIPGAQPHPSPLVQSTAMGAVDPVDPTYRPHLPPEVISKGHLSDSQLENIVYAGQAHQNFLPNGQRQGYFIGDGTGVGKGRQIAGVILDNWNQGSHKAVWLSAKPELVEDARRDVSALGMNPGIVIDLKKNPKALSANPSGIAFAAYSTLRSRNPGLQPHTGEPGQVPQLVPVAEGEKPSRMHMLEKWLGHDFDGVIVFDEAHLAGNAIDIQGDRGVQDASQTGMMVLDIQALFPKAKIVYASATGATDITNLSYGDRLGIWGHGTPFPSKTDFFNAIQSGGLSAMEIVARDLKSMGRYLARTLSFEGVTQRPITHALTSEQRAIYDELSRAWQMVLQHRNETMAGTGMANNGHAVGQANSKFYGAQQRFYNQLLTAMQVPSIIEDMRKEIAKGNSVLLQIVNTGESVLNRELAEKGADVEEGDREYLEDLDLTPKRILIEYVAQHYPVALWEQYTDANGNTRWRPVVDAEGNPVDDPEAVRRRTELLDRLALLKAPTNPLDQIIDTFGVENVGEVTGRTKRVVKVLQPDGTRKEEVQNNRGVAHRQVDIKGYRDDRLKILIFSNAGGTGASYHAGKDYKNQRKRTHYLLQAGWEANKAIQGFGRSHRSDQVVPPEYVPVSTDLSGHKRFISSIMRKLSELGALTGGERKSAGGEMFDESNDLENPYAEATVIQFFTDLYAGEVEGVNFNDLSKKLGFSKAVTDPATGQITFVNTLIDSKTGSLNVSKIPRIYKFLNRILVLEVDEQNHVFNQFYERLKERIDNAKQSGTFDPGTQNLKALAIRKLSDEVVYSHPDSTAKTRLVEIEHEHPIRTIAWENRDTVYPQDRIQMYVRNIKSGRVYVLKQGPSRTMESGAVVDTWRRISPTGYDIVPQRNVKTEGYYGDVPNYEQLDPEQAKPLWENEFAKAPKRRTDRDTYVVGAFLPIWDRLRISQPRIWRIKTDAGETLLGALVPADAVEALRDRLGATGGKAETPESVFRKVLDQGLPVDLANEWKIKRSKVAGENRIEVTGPQPKDMAEFQQFIGGFIERINYVPRFFIPTDTDAGIAALKKLLQKSPAVSKRPPGGIMGDLRDRLDNPPSDQAGYFRLHEMLYDAGKSIYTTGMDFASWAGRMVSQLGDKVRQWLRSLWVRITDPARWNALPPEQRVPQPTAPADVPAPPPGLPTPSIDSAWDNVSTVAKDTTAEIRRLWKSFSMQSLPRITDADRQSGEAGVRYAASPMVARAKGIQFAREVTEGITDPEFNRKFGTALTEDNLRDVKRQWAERADEAESRHELIADLEEQIAELAELAEEGDFDARQQIRSMRKEIRRLSELTDDDARLFRENANNVVTLIGAEGSPFRTEEDYQQFMETGDAQLALDRHIQKWEVEKDPLFIEANDLDPDIELPTRGIQFGARVNLKNLLREQENRTTIRPAQKPPLIRATATLKKTDPWRNMALGNGNYDGSYEAIMANGFAREYPVAKQHEFIRQLIASGNARVTAGEFAPELEINGESTKGYPMKLRPWQNRWLQIPKSMATEYEDAMGLSGAIKAGLYTKAGELMTKMSVQGLAEGSTHAANLLTQVFTGLGPTGDPLVNALLKTLGRADLMVSLPQVLINSFADRKADMLKLAEIGAAKEPYRGGVGWFITKIDHGVRLYAMDVYKKMAANGWVPDTETGLREFVNQVGQYNKRLQPRWMQVLRSTHAQPFATAMQTFNIQGARTMLAAPGARGIAGGGRRVQRETPTGTVTTQVGGHSRTAAEIALRADRAAGFLGFLIVTGVLNYLVSGAVSGPPGTKLGAVGWIDPEDKKLHQLDLGALTGFSRGFRVTGLQGYIEAKRLGLGTGEALKAGSRGIGNAAISTITGPLNRAIYMGLTGQRPSLPPIQEAPVKPPQLDKDFQLIKSQTAANILEAAKQANPLVDFAVRMKEGKYEEAVQRQLSRYMPRTGMMQETIANLPKIVTLSDLHTYTDALSKESRKHPRGAKRRAFINERMKEDGLDPSLRRKALQYLGQKGAFTH